MKELVFEGAEARTYLTEFNGTKAIEKERTKKKYREKELDEKIRRERTREEANLIHKAKLAGVRTPIIYKIDKKKNSIVMEFIKAQKIKEKINSLKEKDFTEIGKNIALLHSNSIVHGDLTTNNILFKKGKTYFIDFGLGFKSNKTEDFAVDLLGFKKTFLSSYPEKRKEWKLIEKGYKWKKRKEVIERIKKVEKRARYL
jgi:Kae1-associated kinase Bud32